MKKIITLMLAATIAIGFTACTSETNNKVTAVGKFYHNMELKDSNGNVDTYYQFRSNDDTVWWVLTETEIGAIPDQDALYVLTYDNNGTTRENKTCDCLPEWNCECEVYDDTFISIATIQN